MFEFCSRCLSLRSLSSSALNLLPVGRANSWLTNASSFSKSSTSTIKACRPFGERPSSTRFSIRSTSQTPMSGFSGFPRHSPLAKQNPVTPIHQIKQNLEILPAVPMVITQCKVCSGMTICWLSLRRATRKPVKSRKSKPCELRSDRLPSQLEFHHEPSWV